MATNPYIDINALYKRNLGREADAGGLQYWSNLAKTMSEADLKKAFYATAAKEAQKDDKGLSAETDAWDEKRIASAMDFYDNNPLMLKTGVGGFAVNAGDTGTTSAAQRLSGLPANQFKFTPAATTPAITSSVRTTPLVTTPTATNPVANPSTFEKNNEGITAPKLDAYQKNPYLDQMAQGITQQMNDNWTRNLAPSIRSGAMAAGGFGGSRQGVVEANGLNDMNRSLGQNLANLYGSDYQQSQGRNLQKYGMDQGYNLGMAGNNLGFANLDANIYNSNFNNSLNSARFGLDAYNTLNANNATGVNSATQIQNRPMDYNNYFNSQYTQYGGRGGTQTGTSTTGTSSNPYVAAQGLVNAGSDIYNLWNRGGGVSTAGSDGKRLTGDYNY